jgi:hypothetical protein
MQGRDCALLLAAALSLGLAACDRGAGGNANAPGRPGTGNPVEATTPAAADTTAGGPSGVKGSQPHAGSSGGDAVPGATGSGTSEAGGRSQTAQPGTGLQGGLGRNAAMSSSTEAGTSSATAGGAVADGGPQLTHKGQTGNR